MRSTVLVFTGPIDVKPTEKAGTALVVGILMAIDGLMTGVKIEGTGEEETQERDGAVLIGNKANMVIRICK